MQSQVYEGTYRELPSITFKEFAESKWLPYITGRVKPLTLRGYRGVIEHYLKPTFGSGPLTDITPDMVREYVETTAKKKRIVSPAHQEQPISPSTVNHSLVILKQMLNHAKQWRYLRDNPALEIQALKVTPVEQDYLNPDEIATLLQHAQEPWKTLFQMEIFTGMRIGELLGLQWEDIDWAHDIIRVRRELFWLRKKEVAAMGEAGQPLWRFSTPKTRNARRAIVIRSRSLKEALELHRLSAPKSPHHLVFCTKNGTPLLPRNVYRKLQTTLTQAGLRTVGLHSLRHTYDALETAAGTHAKIIQAQMGHASITTTLDTYGHVFPAPYLNMGTDLDELVFRAKDAPAQILLRKQAETRQDKQDHRQNPSDATITQPED